MTLFVLFVWPRMSLKWLTKKNVLARAKCVTNEGIVYKLYEVGTLLMLYVGCEVPYSLHLGAQ